jgi:hypothetical protein
MIAAQLADNGVAAWRSLTEALEAAVSGQQQQPGLERPLLPAAWVAAMVPAALKLARRVLPQLHDAETANAVTASAAAATSTGASAGQSTPPTRNWTAECIYRILAFLTVVCPLVVPPGSLEQSPAVHILGTVSCSDAATSSSNKEAQGNSCTAPQAASHLQPVTSHRVCCAATTAQCCRRRHHLRQCSADAEDP